MGQFALYTEAMRTDGEAFTMETIYYNLDARRVSVCNMASGETSPQCRSYAVLRKVEEKRAGAGGKVLDLETYRRKLSAESGEEESKEEPSFMPAAALCPAFTEAETPARRRARRAGFALDLFATLAILIMAVVVVIGFLPLL